MGAALALALGIGASTLILVRQAERDTLTAVHDRELAEVVRSASNLSRRVVNLQQSLRLTAQQLDAAKLADRDALGRFLSGQALLRELFSVVYVVGADGQLLMLMRPEGLSTPAMDLFDRPYFQRSLSELRPLISPALPSRLSGDPLIVFSHPLLSDGRPVGVLVGAMNLSQPALLAPVVDPGSTDDEALRVVTDADGRILAHPDASLVRLPLSAEPRLAGALQRWRDAGSPVEPGGLMLMREDGVVSVGGVAGPDWVVWRAVDKARLLEPLHTARRHALAWAAALVLASSLLLFLSTWWQLRPLDSLGRRAENLFDADLAPDAGWPAAGGEIGRLSRVLRRVGIERVRLEMANYALLQQLGSVMQHAPAGITFTRSGRFELVSHEFCRLLGRGEAELLGQSAAIIYDSLHDYEALGPRVGRAFAAGEAFVGEVRMRRANGERFWAHLRGKPVDGINTQAGTIWTVTDVTEQVNKREQLEWTAHHDVLTGLANRSVFEQRLLHCFNAQPTSLPAAVVMIDLDHFKPINDRAGHAAGDAMLQAVAAALRSQVRTHDLAVRLGGDEFALLLEHCPHEVALNIAGAVRTAINDIDLSWGGHTLGLSASLGVASLVPEMNGVSAWLKAADEACYEAKAAGRNQVMAVGPRPGLRVVTG